jgi:hypothetical protein
MLAQASTAAASTSPHPTSRAPSCSQVDAVSSGALVLRGEAEQVEDFLLGALGRSFQTRMLPPVRFVRSWNAPDRPGCG